MKKFRGVMVLFLVFSLIFTFASCGSPNTTEKKENPMTSGGINIAEKVPNTGLFFYFNVSRDDTKAMQDLQKKMVDKGIMPMFSEGLDEDTQAIVNDMKKIMDKYSDITDRQYGIVALDMKTIQSLEDKSDEDIHIGPDAGIYVVVVTTFTKEVKVSDYLADVKDILEKIKEEEKSGAEVNITVDAEKGTINIQPEDGPSVEIYLEQKDKSIVFTVGTPFSKMAKASEDITKNQYWKEATAHSLAFFLDPTAIPDEKTREEMVNAGFQKPLRIYGDISSEEKDGVYTSHFTLTGYNPTNTSFDNLGIDGDVSVVKNADIILAVDTDIFVRALSELSGMSEEFGQYRQMADMFAGGVLTLSVAVHSLQDVAGALVGQYFSSPDNLWNMIDSMTGQYLDALKYQMPGVYTHSQKTKDGFQIIVGTFQPDMVSEAISSHPVLYLKLNIKPSKYADIFQSYDADMAKQIQQYAEVVDNAQVTISVTYDKGKNAFSLDVLSSVKTK